MKNAWIIILLLSCFNLGAQSLELGLGVGRTIYWGDLNSGRIMNRFNHQGGNAFEVFARYTHLEKFGLRINLLHGKVRGDDAFSTREWQRLRNLNFHSQFTEGSIRAEYFPLGYNANFITSSFSPFVSAGIGMFYFNPKTEYSGSIHELRYLGTEGQGLPGFKDFYGRFAISALGGVGVIYKISHRINIALEGHLRWTTTDYIDDVSTVYVNREELIFNGRPLAAVLSDRTPELTNIPSNRPTGSQRGGASVNDYVISTMINLSVGLWDNTGRYVKKDLYHSKCPTF
jgi:hypothetical protein